MRVVDVVSHPSSAQVTELTAFVEAVAERRGGRPLSDHLWLDLRAGGADGFVAVVARDASGPLAYAQISAANDSSSLESFATPGADDAMVLERDVVETAIDAHLARGGGALTWWVDDATDDDLAYARGLGFTPARGLYEMRRSLPMEQRSGVATRAFRPGEDEDAWLEVNNRAFAAHGEQGGWTRDVLALRQAEPWFDPDGFRIHEIDGRLAAFCWTKLHDELDPVVGEIYVIAVDPDVHGRGLGKQLTLAGLDSIADRGVTEANLYVDADNEAAVGLYRGLGFTVHRHRRALSADATDLARAGHLTASQETP